MSNVGWHVTQKFVILVPDPIAFAPRQEQLSDFVETKKYWTLPKSCGSQSSEWEERKKSRAKRGSLCTRDQALWLMEELEEERKKSRAGTGSLCNLARQSH